MKLHTPLKDVKQFWKKRNFWVLFHVVNGKPFIEQTGFLHTSSSSPKRFDEDNDESEDIEDLIDWMPLKRQRVRMHKRPVPENLRYLG